MVTNLFEVVGKSENVHIKNRSAGGVMENNKHSKLSMLKLPVQN
jgi:hypothetical protein